MGISPLFTRILSCCLLLIAITTLSGFADMGRITVSTDPEGADAWLIKQGETERIYLGKTPVKYMEVEEGIYKLEMELDDYEAIIIEEMAVFPGRHKEINKKLSYNYAYLRVESSPESSTVFMDDTRIGQTPYTHSLVLPGTYTLKLFSRDSLVRPSKRTITLNKRDSMVVKKQHHYRNKSFGREHLSLPPWTIQLEAGFIRMRHNGEYDKTGTDPNCTVSISNPDCKDPDSLSQNRNFSSDSVKTRITVPLILRLAIPNDIEFHLHLPFSQYSPLLNESGPFGPADLEMGMKYTLRKFNVGFDATYKFDNGNFSDLNGTGYKALRLSAFGMMAKDGFQGFGNLGYEFRFSQKGTPELDIGDKIFAYGQVGYLMHPWTPYLAASGEYYFSDVLNGNEQLENDGYLLFPEVGVIIEPSENFALQAGIPFTIVGKNTLKHWAFHFSIAYNFGVY